MTIDITVDSDTETVHATLDSSISLYARRNDDGNVVYSNSFDEITDDDIHDALKAILTRLIRVVT
jgi:hypothetical protein